MDRDEFLGKDCHARLHSSTVHRRFVDDYVAGDVVYVHYFLFFPLPSILGESVVCIPC